MEHGRPHYRPHAHENARDPHRVLRVGYVSGDFRHHSANVIFAPVVLEHSDRFKVYGYSTCPLDKHDLTTGLYRDDLIWREVHTMTPATLARTVREDKIDILVDLSGFTRYNRLETFCAKPAPVQVTAWGYAVPTELPVFDAFFSDPVHMPPWARTCVDPVVDLPCVVTYDPPMGMPDPTPLSDRPPVFAAFHRAIKIDPEVLHAWRDILLRVSGSTMIIKGPSWSGNNQNWVMQEMGDTARQVQFHVATPHHAHMRSYADTDLSLDPFRHSGGVTTLEATWMGVPTLTLPGERPFSRISASVYTAMDHQEFIVKNRQQYVEDAVAWVTTRRGELSHIRQSLRGDLQRSPVMTGYVEAVEDAYRTLWQQWCRDAS